MATFNFNCPECGNLLSGEDEWRGMESECPYCQKAIIIPGDKDYENSDIPQKTACRKKQILKILIPVVSICLIAVVVFLWSCNSSKSAGSSTGEKQQSSSIKTNTTEHSKAKSTESFAYHFRLPVTDDAICLELWSNLPGSIQKWIIVTQAGKRWKLHCKEQIPQNIDGKKMYVAQYFFPKAWYLDNLIFDPIASMELTVVNTESSNDLSFVLSDTDKVLFAKLNESITSPSSTQTFTAQSVTTSNTENQQSSDVIKFMGIPLEGDIETFAKQLEAKGWKFESKTPLRIDREYGLINEETWYFEDGKFWEFSKCYLEVKVLTNSRLIYSVEVSRRYYYDSVTQELLEALSKIYGKFSKDHEHHLNCWDRQIGHNRIRVLESVHYRGNVQIPALKITYANHLEKENERIQKEFSDEVARRRKAEREAKRRRANQDL